MTPEEWFAMLMIFGGVPLACLACAVVGIYRAGRRKGYARGYSQAEYDHRVCGRFFATENEQDIRRRAR